MEACLPKCSIALSTKNTVLAQYHLTGKIVTPRTHLEGFKVIVNTKPRGQKGHSSNYHHCSKCFSTPGRKDMNCIMEYLSLTRTCYQEVIKFSVYSTKLNAPGSYKLLADIVEARCSLLSSTLCWIPLSLLCTVLERSCDYYADCKLPTFHRYHDNKASSYTWSWTHRVFLMTSNYLIVQPRKNMKSHIATITSVIIINVKDY